MPALSASWAIAATPGLLGIAASEALPVLPRIVLSSVAAIAAGLPLVAPRRRPAAGDLAAAWALSLGNASVLALAAGLAGLTLSPAVILVLIVVPGVAAAALVRRRRPMTTGPERGGSAAPAQDSRDPALPRESREVDAENRESMVIWVSRLALACALAVLIFKFYRAPLWGWDHFAVWGVKARRMLEGGHLRLGFLTALYQTRTDHPLGVPMAWLVLTLGQAPSPAVFKVLHSLFALALIASLRTAVARLTKRPALANAAAAALAISPPLWDTEVVGLSEVPLALWAIVALSLLLPPDERSLRQLWVAGLAIGFLPWIKQEGLTLGLLLLLPAALLVHRSALRDRGRSLAGLGTAGGAGTRGSPAPLGPSAPVASLEALRPLGLSPALARFARLVAPALLLMAGAQAIQRFILPPGVTFFIGPWLRRGLDRLPLTADIFRQCATDLLQPDWLGFWLLFTGLTGVALVTRKTLALALAAVVWAQALIYALTAFFSYISPPDHLRAAFFRICGPLLPIGILAMAALVRDRTAASRAEPASQGVQSPANPPATRTQETAVT